MKNILKILTIILCVPLMILAQDVKENSLRLFDGGSTKFDFSFRTDLFCGIGSSVNQGAVSLDRDASSIFWNPAQLAFLPRRQLLLDILPSVTMYVSKWYDLSGQIKSAVDNAIVEYKTEATAIQYPTINPFLHHRGGVNAGILAVPLSQFWSGGMIAFGYSQAFDMRLDLLSNGFSTLLETRKPLGTQTKLIKFRMNMDMNLQSQMQINRFSLAVAKKWTPQWATGVTIDRYWGNIFLDGKFMISGIMETAGSEFAFNDPYDPYINFAKGEQNNLDQAIYTSFKGQSWGIKMGGIFQPQDKLAFGTLFEIVPTMTVTGRMQIVQNIIPALNAEALLGDSDDEIMDPAKLDLAKLTLTVPYNNPTTDRCKIRFPSSLRLGVAYQSGFFKGSLNLITYFNRFSFSALGRTRGIKFKYGVRSGLDFKYIQLGLGVIAADEVQEGTENDAEAMTNIFLPQISLSFGFTIYQDMRTETLLFLAPTPIFKQSVVFGF